MAVQQQYTSHPLSPAPPVSWRFSPLPTRIFGLLPDACSSESSDIELEHKLGLQQIEEERKLRKQQQFERYRSFLEEQKQKFYRQQRSQYLCDDVPDLGDIIRQESNGYVQEQESAFVQKQDNCNINGYSQEQQCSQSEYVQRQNKYDLNGCVQDQLCPQSARVRGQDKHSVNGYIQEQSECAQNRGKYDLEAYVREQQYRQSDPYNSVNECVQEQYQCDLSEFVQDHCEYQPNGYNQAQPQQAQEHQIINDSDQCYEPYQIQEEQYQYVGNEPIQEYQYIDEEEEGFSQQQFYNQDTQPNLYYNPERSEDVPLEQSSCPEEQRLIEQQEASEGGRLFCIVGPAGSGRLATYAAMSTLARSSEGMRLELAGVTLDSSTDDLSSIATTCGRRNARQHRNDLSMDSGIQGSSCDLAAASSGSDLEENIDNDSLNRSLEVTVPDCPVDRNLTSTIPSSSTRVSKGQTSSDMEMLHGETFNLVEEVYITEDSKQELRSIVQEQATDENCAFSSQQLSIATELTLDSLSLHSPCGLTSPQLPSDSASNTNYDENVFQNSEPTISDVPRTPELVSSNKICNGHRTPRNLSPVSEESTGDNSTLNLDPATRTYVSYSSPSLDDVTVVETITKSSVKADTSNMSGVNKLETNVSRDVGNNSNGVHQESVCQHFVVVAIDIGTTYSGYAFCFTRDPDSNIYMMRKWEGGDPGLNNQKTPTTLLLNPNGEFHSFGFAARDFFHDLDIQEAKKWLYFDKFKMDLHHNQDLNRNTELKAANGQSVLALIVFAHALRHLKIHALRELSDQIGSNIAVEDVRWVVTVPAIWKQPAKQFMREAAYRAGLCEPHRPEGLLIALEPEAASICCRKLRLNQLVPERPAEQADLKLRRASSSTLSLEPTGNKLVLEDSTEGTRYMVVDCGGGTVDITVHELSECHGTLRELHKATGGPWGSMGVDYEFERLLEEIFEVEFMAQFKLKRPAAYVELLLSFEARKRSASPYRDSSFNIFPPFAFIDYYRKYKGKEVEQAVKKYGRKDITWSTQGMLRLQPTVMMELFRPMVDKIIQHIRDVLESPRVHGIKFLFMVGGFAESQILQHEVRKTFSDKVKVIIPQGVSLTILRGAVLFGLNPGLVTVRRSKQTYGVGVLKRFIHGVHPPGKLIEKDGVEWCADVLDKFVSAEQSVGIGETVVRRYTPACPSQKTIIINVYCADSDEAQFITDRGVRCCGTLSLDIPDIDDNNRREIHTRMVFGGTEVMASALDLATGHTVHAEMDFLTISNDTEV